VSNLYGDLIRSRRIHMGWTEEQLAGLLNIEPGVLAAIEDGRQHKKWTLLEHDWIGDVLGIPHIVIDTTLKAVGGESDVMAFQWGRLVENDKGVSEFLSVGETRAMPVLVWFFLASASGTGGLISQTIEGAKSKPGLQGRVEYSDCDHIADEYKRRSVLLSDCGIDHDYVQEWLGWMRDGATTANGSVNPVARIMYLPAMSGVDAKDLN